MASAIDPAWLGERLAAEREKRGLTLEQVSKATEVSVPTLSRIERGVAKGLNSDTLVKLSDWIGLEVKMLMMEADPVLHRGKPVNSTPDIVALHLRADKNLDHKTAAALATLFRTVYDQVRQQVKKG